MSADDAIPTTQKAWVVATKGKPREAMVLKTDQPVPKPKSGEVLVRVRAAALNPVCYKLMGALPNFIAKRPYVAEYDLSGVVVDANNSSFSNGDEVFGFIPIPLQFSSHQGTLAQYTTLPADCLARKPSVLSWEDAAAFPVTAMTALQALRTGGLDPARALADAPDTQESIFINGGSTSVGIYATQIAKAMSLQVTVSASARNESFVRGVGADNFLDYTAQPLAEQLSANVPEPQFSMVLDAAGVADTGIYVKSKAYVKKHGVYVTTGPSPGKDLGILRVIARWMGVLLRPSWLGGVPTSWKIVQLAVSQEDMKLLCTLVERGALRAYIDSTYDFESAMEAYDKLMTGRVTGKVVVRVE